MVDDASEPIERWTAKRRAARVVSLLKGETSAAEAAWKHARTVADLEEWRERFLSGWRTPYGVVRKMRRRSRTSR